MMLDETFGAADPTIVLSPSDNVAVAKSRLDAGAPLPGGSQAREKIDPGHKVAIRPIPATTG